MGLCDERLGMDCLSEGSTFLLLVVPKFAMSCPVHVSYFLRSDAAFFSWENVCHLRNSSSS